MAANITDQAKSRYNLCRIYQNDIQPLIDANHNKINTEVTHIFTTEDERQGERERSIFDGNVTSDLNFNPQVISDLKIKNIRIMNKDPRDYTILFNDDSIIKSITSFNDGNIRTYTCEFSEPEPETNSGRVLYDLFSREYRTLLEEIQP